MSAFTDATIYTQLSPPATFCLLSHCVKGERIMMVRAVALNVAQRQQTGEVSRILLPVTITHSRKRLAVRISWHGKNT